MAVRKELAGCSLMVAEDLIEILQENLYDLIDIKAALDKAPKHAIKDVIVNIFMQALDMMFRSPDHRLDDAVA